MNYIPIFGQLFLCSLAALAAVAFYAIYTAEPSDSEDF